MTSKLSLSSSISSATLVAINSITAATVAANDKQNHRATVATDDPLKVVSVEQDGITSTAVKQTKRSETVGRFLDNAEREDRLFTTKSSTAAMKPDVGILSKDFLKNKGREQPADKHFAIHRKKGAAEDVDVGILSNKRRHGGQWQHQKKVFDANLHAENKVVVRSLQSEEELPFMCPGKNGGPGYFFNLFDKTDGYFSKCSCPSPTYCGPVLCTCLELDADGDIFQCMDSLNQLCEGTMDIDGVPGPWSMEECLGNKFRALNYCSMLPCFADGGSYWQCKCQSYDSLCSEYRDKRWCAMSKCCQAQIDDEGREACRNGDLHENYYNEDASIYIISYEEMISRFNKCSFDSDSGKSIVQCYCESFSYGQCVTYGVMYPNICEANFCCFEQTDDDARLDCFTTRFRDGRTGVGFYRFRDTIQESCVASGRSSDQCRCDVQGLSNCVYGIDSYNRELHCDLFQCCQSQTGDDDDGKKDCLVQDEAQLIYETCVNNGNSTESCVCDKSITLCSSGHSNGLHCELSSCCQEQVDDTGRKECIDNFTTSQPSSAPSEYSVDEAETSPTATSALPGTSSAFILTSLDLGAKPLTKTTSKMLAVTAAVIGWLLFT